MEEYLIRGGAVLFFRQTLHPSRDNVLDPPNASAIASFKDRVTLRFPPDDELAPGVLPAAIRVQGVIDLSKP